LKASSSSTARQESSAARSLADLRAASNANSFCTSRGQWPHTCAWHHQERRQQLHPHTRPRRSVGMADVSKPVARRRRGCVEQVTHLRTRRNRAQRRGRARRRLCKPGRPVFLRPLGEGGTGGEGGRSASICRPAREVECLWILWTVWTSAPRTEKRRKKKSRRARLRLPRTSALAKETGCGSPSSVCK